MSFINYLQLLIQETNNWRYKTEKLLTILIFIHFFLDINFSVSPPYGLAFIQNPNLLVLIINPKFVYLPSWEEHTMPKGWHAEPCPPPPIFLEGKWILLVSLGGGIQSIIKRRWTLWYRCGSFLRLGMILFWATFL